MGAGLLDEAAHLVVVGHVRSEGDGAIGAELTDKVGGGLGAATVVDDDDGAFTRERPRDLCAQAPCASGHQDYLLVDSHAVSDIHCHSLSGGSREERRCVIAGLALR